MHVCYVCSDLIYQHVYTCLFLVGVKIGFMMRGPIIIELVLLCGIVNNGLSAVNVEGTNDAQQVPVNNALNENKEHLRVNDESVLAPRLRGGQHVIQRNYQNELPLKTGVRHQNSADVKPGGNENSPAQGNDRPEALGNAMKRMSDSLKSLSFHIDQQPVQSAPIAFNQISPSKLKPNIVDKLNWENVGDKHNAQTALEDANSQIFQAKANVAVEDTAQDIGERGNTENKLPLIETNNNFQNVESVKNSNSGVRGLDHVETGAASLNNGQTQDNNQNEAWAAKQNLKVLEHGVILNDPNRSRFEQTDDKNDGIQNQNQGDRWKNKEEKPVSALTGVNAINAANMEKPKPGFAGADTDYVHVLNSFDDAMEKQMQKEQNSNTFHVLPTIDGRCSP